MIVGYEVQRRRLAELRQGLGSGRGGAVALVGGPGSGKTALCGELAAGAGTVRVLHVVGAPPEQAVAFTALDALARPVTDRLEQLPEPHRTAIASALGTVRASGPDRLALGAAVITLLETCAPVLVMVDDAQWVDPSSLAVLSFVARRTATTGVGVVVASRPDETVEKFLAGIEEVMLAGLDTTSATRLVASVAAVEVPERVVRQLHRLSGGTPLGLIAMAEHLPADLLRGRRPFHGAELSLDPSADPYTIRLLALSAEVRLALATVAAGADAPVGVVVGALERLGLQASTLHEAAATGMVVVDSKARFVHPLIAAAAAAVMPPETRTRVHRALAAVTTDDEGRVWHLAVAADGPDEVLAGELLRVGDEVARRGGFPEAASFHARAEELATSTNTTARARFSAARCWHLAGLPERAAGVLDRLLREGPGPREQEAHLLRSEVDLWSGRPLQAIDRLTKAADGAADPMDAAMLRLAASMPAIMTGQVAAGLQFAEVAHRALRHAQHPGWPLAAVCLAQALLLTGQRGRGEALLDELRGRVDVRRVREDGVEQAFLFAHALMLAERDADAEELLEGIIAFAERTGGWALLPLPLTNLADLRHRQGRLGAARDVAERARDLAVEIGHTTQVGHSEAILARIAAGAGDVTCRKHAAAALGSARASGAASLEGYVAQALGVFELGGGHLAEAITHLEAAVGITTRHGVLDPAVVPARPDLVEAHVRAGQLGAARRVLAELDQVVATTSSRWGRAAALRSRGLLEADVERLQASVAEFERLGLAVEEARSRLCLGEVLGRLGRPRRAREELVEAESRLTAAGALGWAARAGDALASLDGTRSPLQGPTDQLTDREREIAALASRGATNREIAAQLFLSPKTVENRLTGIYGRLGVRSRTELAALLLQR